jgi:hypothetical protein
MLAVFVEVPLAGFCVYMARHSEQVAERAYRYALTARDVRQRRGEELSQTGGRRRR